MGSRRWFLQQQLITRKKDALARCSCPFYWIPTGSNQLLGMWICAQLLSSYNRQRGSYILIFLCVVLYIFFLLMNSRHALPSQSSFSCVCCRWPPRGKVEPRLQVANKPQALVKRRRRRKKKTKLFELVQSTISAFQELLLKHNW